MDLVVGDEIIQGIKELLLLEVVAGAVCVLVTLDVAVMSLASVPGERGVGGGG